MKNLVFIALFLFSLTAAKAGVQVDTTHNKTPLRIMLPADKQGWVYYFFIEGSGKPAIALEGMESAMTLSTNSKKSRMGYIYAVNTDKKRQTNNFAIKLTGKPLFLVVKGTNGIAVSAHKAGINRYSILRNALPEAQRAPWN